MAGKRPIRIQIPDDLQLTEKDIEFLDNEFQALVAVVQKPGDPPVSSSPVNTTRPPVEIEVIGPVRTASSRKSAKRPAKKGAKGRK